MMVVACGAGPNPVCVAGVAVLVGTTAYHGIRGTIDAINAYNESTEGNTGLSKDTECVLYLNYGSQNVFKICLLEEKFPKRLQYY